MAPPQPVPDDGLYPLVVVRAEPPGQYTAQAVGLPQVGATAATRAEAVEQVRTVLQQWLASGQLVPVEVTCGNPVMQGFGRVSPNDPAEQAYLEELARQRQEDRDQTQREYPPECSHSSSMPTL